MAAHRGRSVDPAVHRLALNEAIEALYAARHRCDVAEFVSYFALDARMVIPGNPVLNPGAGMRLGRESIGRHLERLHAENEYLDYCIRAIMAEGDMVVVRWQTHLRVLANGRGGTIEVSDHMRLRGNLIAEMTQFYDTGTLAILSGRIALA